MAQTTPEQQQGAGGQGAGAVRHGAAAQVEGGAPNINILNQQQNQPAVLPNRPETHYYRATTDQAADTNHALDTSLMNLSRTYLGEGEVRHMSRFRAGVIPAVVGASGGLLKSLAGIGGWESIPAFGLLTGVLSPIFSGIRRLTGENAFSQFARFANRAEDRGIMSRLVHGGESRAVKGAFLREDRDVRQLMRVFDQGTNPADADPNSVNNRASRQALVDRLNFGSRDTIDRLIAAGVMAEMKAQLVAENDIQLSPQDHQKIERYHQAFEMAKLLYDRKIPTAGQRALFVNNQLPRLLQGMERRLWGEQTARVAGIGMLKTMALATLGHLITAANIISLSGNAFLPAAIRGAPIKGLIPQMGEQAAAWTSSVLNAAVIPGAKTVGNLPYNVIGWVKDAMGQPYPFGSTPPFR